MNRNDHVVRNYIIRKRPDESVPPIHSCPRHGGNRRKCTKHYNWGGKKA